MKFEYPGAIGRSWEIASVSMTTITDPALNAAVSTAIVDAYAGVIITLTGAGNAQTLQNPTDTVTYKRFTVVSNDSNGTNAIEVNGITLSAGEAQKFLWDGSAWIAVTAVDADDIAATPHGDIAATEVQAYLDELEDEKVKRITSIDNEIARFHLTGGDVQGYTSNAPTVSDDGQMAVPGKLNVGSSVNIEGTKDEDDMASNSSVQLVTQQSIKAYVDAVASGLDIKKSCDVAIAVALPACTAAGSGVGKTLTADAVGVLAVDGVATVLNNRILVKNQVAGADNGIYKVTTEGTAGVAFVLTRAIDFDQDVEVTAGAFAFVEEGTVNADYGFVLTTNDPITVDTTSLAFSKFSSAGAGLVDVVDDPSPQLGNFLDANGHYIQMEKGGDLASANPLVIDTDGDYFDVTGTTNFASMTVAADRHFFTQFDAILTMTHHATNLDLPGEANITTAAGDVAEWQSTGVNTVQCVNYTRASGEPLTVGYCSADAELSGTPKLFQINDDAGTAHYFKAYPTKP